MGVIAEAHVTNFGPRGEIATGICFLDHMIDQLTAHAQLGVSVRVSPPSESRARICQEEEAQGWL